MFHRLPLEDDKFKDLETYDINKIFFVAFLGGIIPTVILGTMNSKWLKVEKWKINLLIAVGVIILILKFTLFGIIPNDNLGNKARYFKWAYRIASIVLFSLYYAVMKKRYKQFMLLRGQCKPILKDAVIWSLVGMVVEIVLLFIAGGF